MKFKADISFVKFYLSINQDHANIPCEVTVNSTVFATVTTFEVRNYGAFKLYCKNGVEAKYDKFRVYLGPMRILLAEVHFVLSE